MNYNGRITRRINQWLRPRIVTPKKRARLVKEDISILCNNCTGGFILHDLGLRFDSPTINMFFMIWTFLTLLNILNITLPNR